MSVARTVQRDRPGLTSAISLPGTSRLPARTGRRRRCLPRGLSHGSRHELAVEASQRAVLTENKRAEADSFAAALAQGHPQDAAFRSYLGDLAHLEIDYPARRNEVPGRDETSARQSGRAQQSRMGHQQVEEARGDRLRREGQCPATRAARLHGHVGDRPRRFRPNRQGARDPEEGGRVGSPTLPRSAEPRQALHQVGRQVARQGRTRPAGETWRQVRRPGRGQRTAEGRCSPGLRTRRCCDFGRIS